MLVFLACVMACEDEKVDCNETTFPWVKSTPFDGNTAHRLSLVEYCRGECTTLQEFEAELECEPFASEGAYAHWPDAGFEDRKWVRSEGCGTVQFSDTEYWESYRNFDPDSGAMIGAANFSSDVLPADGCPIGRIAGVVRSACDDEELLVCFEDREEVVHDAGH